tara:strand:- start:3391 stop:4434 length:1044 start_codon:yes stop_codon:yes gene_type:complete
MDEQTQIDPLQQAARLLNEAAPEGEGLAYINRQEADVLMQMGGAGEPVNSSGVPSFFLNRLFGGGKDPRDLERLDAGKSARDYVAAMSDPGMHGDMLRLRQQYDPQYQDHQMNLAQRAVDPMGQIAESSANRSYDTQMRMSDRMAGDLRDRGAAFTESVRSADPLMQARTQQANQMADQAYQESQMTDLSPEMRRRATQSAREGLVARGRGLDNAGIAAEAMSREDYLRDIIRDKRSQAQGLGNYASNLNQSTADPLMMFRTGQSGLQSGLQERNALFGLPQESITRINPDAGVNIGMQELANRANYDSNNYAANEQAAAGAEGAFWNAVGTAASSYGKGGKTKGGG